MPAPKIYSSFELLSKVAKGDERAFDQLYYTYSKKVYLFAFKILQSEVLSEEVMQEVMLKLWKMGRELEKVNNLDSYLRTASKNASLNMLRQQEAENRADELLANSWKESHNETEEQVILNETRKILINAIALLPQQQREVYKLCHQQGLKYEEAARQLNLSPATVATHMKLALRFLRSYLQKNTDIVALFIIFKLF